MNNYLSRLLTKYIKFWRENKHKIMVVVIIVLIIFIINKILKNYNENVIPEPSTTYTPHVSVLDEEEIVPEQYREQIVNLVDEYFNYCNNGEYENAYNLITQECRNAYYPTLDEFKGYVDEVFEGKKKIYNIQSYSIVDNTYVYSIRILDDILATGTTDGYYYYEEKLILKEENGEMRLSIGEFISQEQPNIIIEDDYMKVKIVRKTIDYETETYNIEIENKTDKYIVICDNSQGNEIILSLEDRDKKPANLEYSEIIVKPNSGIKKDLIFNKFYDDGLTSQKLVFGAVRVLNEYDASLKTTEQNLNDAVKLYSLEIPLK